MKLNENGGLYRSMILKKINLILFITLTSSFALVSSLSVAHPLTKELKAISSVTSEIEEGRTTNSMQNEESQQMQVSLEKLITSELDMNLAILDKRFLELLDGIRESNNIELFDEASETYNKVHSRNLFLHDVPYKLLNKNLRNNVDQISFINQHLNKRIPYLEQLQEEYEKYISTYQLASSLNIESKSLYHETSNSLNTILELNEPIDFDMIGSAVFTFTPTTSGKYTVYTAPYGGIGSPNYVDIVVYQDASLTEELGSTEEYEYDDEYFHYSKLTLNMITGNTYYIKFFSNSIIHNRIGVTTSDLITNAYLNNWTVKSLNN